MTEELITDKKLFETRIRRGEWRLSYEPSTGNFYWLTTKTPWRIRADKVVGTVNKNGYRYIHYGKNFYRAHSLAWLFIHGEWSTHEIDHIDGDRDNNRIENLRAATRAQNQQNRIVARADSVSGLIGVGVTRTAGRWRARIQANGKKIIIGTFASKQEAFEAYCAMKRILHVPRQW